MARFNPRLGSELIHDLVVDIPEHARAVQTSRLFDRRVRDERFEDGAIVFSVAVGLLPDWEIDPTGTAADKLVGLIQRNLPEGWGPPGDELVDTIKAAILARWVAVCGWPAHDAIEVAKRFINAHVDEDWTPRGVDDDVFFDLFDGA